jgi:hypothetical protein
MTGSGGFTAGEHPAEAGEGVRAVRTQLFGEAHRHLTVEVEPAPDGARHPAQRAQAGG